MPKERGQKGEGGQTVASWCEQCVDVVMPAQQNRARPRYSEETLADLRQVVRRNIIPRIGRVRLSDLDKATVSDLIAGQPNDDLRAKTLYVLTRIMELAETKGQRKKGTNPCKGVSLAKLKDPGAPSPHPRGQEPRPEDWRDRSE